MLDLVDQRRIDEPFDLRRIAFGDSPRRRRLSSTGRDAGGTNLDMVSAVRNAMELLGLYLIAAVGMASRNPASFLGLANQLGSIRAGQKANLVLVNDTVNVLDTGIGGRAQRKA